jgi:hypothetical protein
MTPVEEEPATGIPSSGKFVTFQILIIRIRTNSAALIVLQNK